MTTANINGFGRAPTTGVADIPSTTLKYVLAYPDVGSSTTGQAVITDANGVTISPVTGSVVNGADDATYYLTLETIDTWLINGVALTAPFKAYWKIVEHYTNGHETIRKIRPLASTGTARVIDVQV